MDQQPGSITGALAIAAMDRAEALDKATVELQATIREQLTRLQTGIQQQTGEMHTLLRQEAGALQLLRQELKRSVDELRTLEPGIERSAAVGVRKAVAESLGEIRTETGAALSRPLMDIEQAAGHVRQNIKESNGVWLTLILEIGMVLGLLLGYLPLRRDQGRLEEQMNRIEQSLAAQQRPAPASLPPVPASPTGTHQKSHGGKKAAQKIESDQPSAISPLPDQP